MVLAEIEGAGVEGVGTLDPHRLVGSDEPYSIAEMRIAEHGRVTSLEILQVKGCVFLRIAVGDGTLESRRGGRVGRKGWRGNTEVVLAHKRGGHHHGATLGSHGHGIVEHGHLVGTVAEGRAVVDVRLGSSSHANFLDGKVGRIELGERARPLGADPAHAGAELANGIDGVLHQSQRSVGAPGSAGHADGHEAAGNLLNGQDREGAKVGSTNFREKTLHEKGYSVEMRNHHERVGRGTVVLQVADWHPEKPGAERLKTLVLLGNGKTRAHLAGTLEETNEMLDLGGILSVVAEMGLYLLNLVQSALESVEIILARLAGAVLRIGRWGSSGESRAFGDEVGEERLVLPGFHGIDDGRGALHELGPAAPIVGLPGEDKRGGQDSVGSLARKGANGGVQAAQGSAAVIKRHVGDALAGGEEANVHGGKGQESVHHVGSVGANLEKIRNVASPEGEVVGIHGSQLLVESSEVVDEAEILDRVELSDGSRVETERGERENTSALPLGNVGLDLRSPHQVGLVVGSGSALRLGCDLDVIVRASNLVLGAVAALRKALVTANVTAFAGFTALARLGVGAARRTTTGTGHCIEEGRLEKRET